MKYLVLGSAGQIGSALVNFLRNKGEEVLTIDLVNSVTQDLRIHNNTLVESYIEQCDFVYFLAFDVGGARYLEKYQYTFDFIQNNNTLMSNTFELIKKHNKPFIFASSQMSNMTHSTYGVLKAIGERYTAILDGITVKFWNVYGYESDLEKAHVITDFINRAKLSGVIEMMTDGKERRQFLHVDDCSDCLYKLSKVYYSLPRISEYHITSFVWTSIIEIANIIQSYYPNSIIVPGTLTDIVQFDKMNEPSENILKYWQPKINLLQGIKQVIDQQDN